MRQDQLPRCDNLDGSTLAIKPQYIEAGAFCEANCVTISDQNGREALYVPYKNGRPDMGEPEPKNQH